MIIWNSSTRRRKSIESYRILTGSLKNFFCNPSGHKVTFDHIEQRVFLIAEKDEEYDGLHIILFPDANKFFSSTKV